MPEKSKFLQYIMSSSKIIVEEELNEFSSKKTLSDIVGELVCI